MNNEGTYSYALLMGWESITAAGSCGILQGIMAEENRTGGRSQGVIEAGADRIAVTDPIENIRTTYDAVARDYADAFADDLDDKVLDRALLSAFAEIVKSEARTAAPSGGLAVGDLGCGPGFEARYLADLGLTVTGVDLSPGMVDEAKRRHPGLDFRVGSLLALPFDDASLLGAVAIYSIIHLTPEGREAAYREMARVIRPGGPLLLSFHVSSADFAPGTSRHMSEWWGKPVSLDGHFLEPEGVVTALGGAGFDITARLERGPSTPREFPSKRVYLLATRRAAG
jgi:SAM-dependent methyltransferase